MKKTLLLVLGVIFISACSSVKKSQKHLNAGNYNKAIDIAVNQLQKDKFKKGNQEHILILEDAFKKGTETAKKRIALLQKDGNPAYTREIYSLYANLDRVQNMIYPLLPLSVNGREAKFKFTDYTADLVKAKEDYAQYLYGVAQSQMYSGTKAGYRSAYQTLVKLENIAPGYQDSEKLREDSHFYGTDFIHVSLANRSNQMLPQRLQRDLLDFNTYGLDDFWTVYHSQPQQDIDYDYGIHLDFRTILISPERILEKQIPLELEIKDGFDYKLDRRGNYVLDSLGNRIKIDRFITVRGTLSETVQTKALAVEGRVEYRDLKSNRNINSFPLQTEFVFENIFARFEGDPRVLTREDKVLLSGRFVPFPSNEQMLLDAGDEIKGQLSAILRRNKIR